MNKPKYECIKSWTCINPDGTEVKVCTGDKVKIIFKFKEGDVSKYFLERHLNNVVNLNILELSSVSLYGAEIEYSTSHLKLYPRNIIEITKL